MSYATRRMRALRQRAPAMRRAWAQVHNSSLSVSECLCGLYTAINQAVAAKLVVALPRAAALLTHSVRRRSFDVLPSGTTLVADVSYAVAKGDPPPPAIRWGGKGY
jgi:hypothetical protein